MSRKRTAPLEQVDALLEEYDNLQEQAEAVIDDYVCAQILRSPGVPRPVLRQLFDARAEGYSYPAALRQLRTKLEAGS